MGYFQKSCEVGVVVADMLQKLLKMDAIDEGHMMVLHDALTLELDKYVHKHAQFRDKHVQSPS